VNGSRTENLQQGPKQGGTVRPTGDGHEHGFADHAGLRQRLPHRSRQLFRQTIAFIRGVSHDRTSPGNNLTPAADSRPFIMSQLSRTFSER
jgi:hypothetical protein